MKNKMQQILVGILILTTSLSTLPAHASIVGTEQMLARDASSISLDTVQSYMASEQVAAQLIALGVDAGLVAERVAALSEAELQQLASRIDSQPAGSGALAVVGLVFVVLLVLELVGITNVFTRI